MSQVSVARSLQAGFTLLELMIVVAILAIVASIGVPQYVSALRIARIGKAKQELVTISHSIDSYRANHGGNLPLTLHQVGFGGKRDPWGTPYCYLDYADGTGDGLEWALEAGILDPSAVFGSSSPAATEPAGGGAAGPGALVTRKASIGFGPAAVPQQPTVTARAAATSSGAARTLVAARQAVARPISAAEIGDLTSSLTASGSFSIFLSVPSEQVRRRDRYLFPLNTDYDLFSLGPDARTAVSLGSKLGQDDVIRANDGGFFGVAADY